MAKRSKHRGIKVWIINSTMSGAYFVEGEARIIREIPDVDDQFLVDFMDGFGPVERFVDWSAQADPAGMVSRLNDPEAYREPA